jgi:hypothetical protein
MLRVLRMYNMDTKKRLAYVHLFLLVMSLFSFSYIVSETTPEDDNLLFSFISAYVDSFLPSVSAQGIEGCCEKSKAGGTCVSVSANECSSESPFASGAVCSSTNFCQMGCCYNEEEGLYYNNVIQNDCSDTWVADQFCNLPGAQDGCCVLGETTKFETQGQCRVHTEVFALSEDYNIDWRNGISEIECILLAGEQRVGACKQANGDCTFGSEADCL